jgi:hypothetical protein
VEWVVEWAELERFVLRRGHIPFDLLSIVMVKNGGIYEKVLY